MRDPVCSYCVQWRCRLHGADCSEFECLDNYEPYWANGQAAVVTQAFPCSECQTSLDAMRAGDVALDLFATIPGHFRA